MAILIAAGAIFTSCDKYDGFENKILISGADFEVIQKFVVDEDDPMPTYVLSVISTAVLPEDQEVTLEIDNSLVEAYNAKNQTTFAATPAGITELSATTVTIPAGKSASDIVEVHLTDASVLEDVSYLVPVTIKSTSGSVGILDASRTLFLRIARIKKFPAYDMSYYQANYKKDFGDSNKVTMDKFTFQVNIWMESWHGKSSSSAPPIHRLFSPSSGGASWHLFRFGNRLDTAPDELEWRGNGEVASGMQFYAQQRLPLKTWTNLSLTYDGMKYQIWWNGVPDSSWDSMGDSFIFKIMEFGMTESGHENGQRFTGRISEVRIWSRALSSAEMRSTITGVSPDSEGLVAYWKFNEGEGRLVHDRTDNGFDVEWPVAKALKWVFDDNNKIPE